MEREWVKNWKSASRMERFGNFGLKFPQRVNFDVVDERDSISVH